MHLHPSGVAIQSGTVIFNNIGAHIPRLAGPTLASTDALSLPGALNMYVTGKNSAVSSILHASRFCLTLRSVYALTWPDQRGG